MRSCQHCGAAVGEADKFCANCGAGLEARCETCGTILPPSARFCPSCGAGVAGSGEAPDTGAEERKTVSVLFADLVGFTASSDGADPEDVRRRLSPYHTALRQEVERFGGRIEKLMGDGVLAVFGAPVVHEDDPERAVRAGLRIQERVADLAGSTGLQARVAVGTGEAVVLVDGTTMDREGLVGDVVNTASRLQHEAPPGSVLVDEPTHGATYRAFQYEERPPVAVRGKGEPLAVWVAIQPTGRFGADVEDEGGTLVGRDRELALITDAFTRAVEDASGHVVTIGGEPGVGKSRMVRELRRYIDDLPDLMRWRQGRCLPYGEGITYWALGEIVKAEAGILETDPPGTALGKLQASLEALFADPEERAWVAGRLAALVGSANEPATEKAERFAAWHRYIAALAEQRPTVVVIEDLHWADPALVEFLGDVPEAARGTPLLMVCTARPDFFEAHPEWGAGQRNAVTVRLEPLDADATSSLLEELLEGEDLPAETQVGIVERSGGNPLWAQEFVRMLRDRPDTEGDLALPDTVQSIVAARIDLLDADTKTVIQAASTVGKSFWAGAVRSSLSPGDPDIDSALRELTRRELVRRQRSSTVAGETEYAFTHSVVRDVAYSQVPRQARARRHHLVARWIEAMAADRLGDKAEVLAHHDSEALRLAVATDLADVTAYVEAAIRSHRLAAEQASSLDLTAQRAHLEAALELVPSGADGRGVLLLDLGEALFALGAADSGIKVLLEARHELEASGDMEGWGRATGLLGRYSWTSGDPEASEAYVAEAIAALESLPPGPALASAYSAQVSTLWIRGDSVEEAIEISSRVRPVVEVHGDLQARGRLLMAEGGARFDAGDPSAVEPFRQVLRMAIESDESLGIVTGHLNLGEQLRTGWGMAEAIPVHERGLEVAQRRGLSGGEQFLQQSLAVDYFLVGRWEEALGMVEAGRAAAEPVPYLETGFDGIQATVEACRGVFGNTPPVTEIVVAAEALQDLQAVVPAYSDAMWVSYMEGDDEAALDHARRIVSRAGASRFLVDAFGLPLSLLRPAEELPPLAGVLSRLRRFEMPRPQAQLAFADALLAEEDDPALALELLRAAAARLAELGVVVETVLALAELARVAASVGDDQTRRDAAAQANDLIGPAGGKPLLERLGLV